MTAMDSSLSPVEPWPDLKPAGWEETKDVLHMWTQIVGKVRLELTPLINHWWQVPFYITASGLTTSLIPYQDDAFQIDFDFLASELRMQRSNGAHQGFPLEPISVATFYQKTMDALHALGIDVSIWPVPVELPDPIPFLEDERRAYDADYARNLWHVLLQAHNVCTRFRSNFVGKVSPIHFFWGSFDLAMTFFSGREAPEHPGVPIMPDYVTREAYSHEVISSGFWPGGGGSDAVFYTYAYPEPDGLPQAQVEPDAAFYLTELGEFVLPYPAVRNADAPDEMLYAFLQSSYAAAADLADWDRAALEEPWLFRQGEHSR